MNFSSARNTLLPDVPISVRNHAKISFGEIEIIKSSTNCPVSRSVWRFSFPEYFPLKWRCIPSRSIAAVEVRHASAISLSASLNCPVCQRNNASASGDGSNMTPLLPSGAVTFLPPIKTGLPSIGNLCPDISPSIRSRKFVLTVELAGSNLFARILTSSCPALGSLCFLRSPRISTDKTGGIFSE